jgi:hypothetical protein
MELSQEEKDRIIAEEKLRFETTSQMMKEKWGSGHGHGWDRGFMGYGCHRGCFWKGLLVGILLAVLFCFLCHHHGYEGRGWHHGGYGHWAPQGHFGHGYGGPGPQDQNQDPNPGK